MKKKPVTVPAHIPAAKKAVLIRAIQDNKHLLTGKKVTAGFDGFVDAIVKIIKKKRSHKASSFFRTIKDFGDYIIEKEGTSFSLELEEQNRKLGGNMPIMANALGQLGIPVSCVGALGYPQPHPVFTNLSSNCKPFSFADPGIATAYEFADGKIMLAQMGELNTAGWEKIKALIGIDTLNMLFKESDMICLLNWSEIDASTDTWKGLLKEVLPNYAAKNKNQIAFFDLSDCSKRSSNSIHEALDLLQQFAKHAKVVLSLNKNESRIIYKALFNKDTKKDLSFIGKKLIEKLRIETLVLHAAGEALAFSKDEQARADSFFTSQPKISTGAGDNFNAGFCAARLMELDLESSLVMANAVSGCYVRTGISAQLPDIIDFLETI